MYKVKVGDKILCKKSYLHPTIRYYYIAGKTYEILDINNNYGTRILTTCEEGKHWLWSKENKGSNPEWSTLFEYHFYTMQDLRKLKLERLGISAKHIIGTEE